MNEREYRRAWRELAQHAWEKLQDLAERFRKIGYETDILEADDDRRHGEISQRLRLSTPRGVALATIEYRLFNGQVHGGDGMAIGFSCFGPDAQLGTTYKPGAYTERAFTRDLDELRERIEELPLDDFVAMVQADIARWQMRAIAA